MLWRVAQGDIPAKHHIAHRGPGGALRWEECITRAGFDGSYTIAYHVYRPHEQMVAPELASRGWRAPVAVGLDAPLEKRHFKTQDLKPQGGTALDATEILLFNDDLEVGLVTPTITDDIFRIDGDMDTLLFIYRGKGYVETPLGDLRFETDDYVCIPKGIAHRIHVEDGVEQRYLHLGVQDLDLLKQWRNTSGQLTMDAPYCHRDFRLPELKPVDPSEEGR
ncbi:MAG: homogentisate 1,2-dioxygenase, partial [Myxococcota bacterium]